MTITIDIAPEKEKKLEERAKSSGQSDVAEYVQKLIDKDLELSPSLRELFAPVREDIKASGMTDAELDALLEKAREEAWQERQAEEK
ncbi:MAG: hypothetical protein WKF84_01715 [Pyrinomonadaceae bacterium]